MTNKYSYEVSVWSNELFDNYNAKGFVFAYSLHEAIRKISAQYEYKGEKDTSYDTEIDELKITLEDTVPNTILETFCDYEEIKARGDA